MTVTTGSKRPRRCRILARAASIHLRAVDLGAIHLGAVYLGAVIIAALAAPLGAAPAREAPGPREILDLVLRSPHERGGNHDTLAASWLEAFPRFAGDFRSELLARRLLEIRPYLRDEPALVPLAEAALGAGGEAGGEAHATSRLVLGEFLAGAYRRLGRDADRAAIEKDRGFLLHWLIIGPFGKGGHAPFSRSFPPERDADLGRVYLDGWQELTWRRLEREAPEPLLDPMDHLYPERGVAYLLAQVRSDAAREASLHRGGRDSLAIWLNGVPVARDDAAASFLESRRAGLVRLEEGWNRILVKARSPFWIRLADPRGASFAPGALEEEDEGVVIHPVAEGARPLVEAPYAGSAVALWGDWLRELEEAGGEAEADGEAEEADGEAEAEALRAGARLGLALLHAQYGRHDLAVEAAQGAVDLAPEDPFVLFHAGDIFRGAGYLPEQLAKSRARSAFEAAIARDPGFVPAHERLAHFLELDAQYAKAAARVEEGLRQNAGFLGGILRLRSLASRAGWIEEEIAAVREIEALAPASPVPSLFFARRHEERANPARAEELLKKALELDRSAAPVHESLARLALARGDGGAAERALREWTRREPDSVAARRALLELLIDLERAPEALEAAAWFVRTRPFHPETRILHGRLHEAVAGAAGGAGGAGAAGGASPPSAEGARGKALDEYRAALELAPGRHSLRRFLAGRDGADDAFWLPHDEALEDWVDRIPEDGPLVEKASSVVVLDITVVEVQPDGSSSEYTHQAFKLLSEESKEDLARVRIPGEVVTLRTVTPAGEVLEPVAAEGRGSYLMPGLAPGAFIELAYRRDRSGEGRPFDQDRFYFQDGSYKQSFLLSRLVVIYPDAGVDLAFVENNLAGAGGGGGAGRRPGGLAEVEKTVQRGGGRTVVIYEARSSARLEAERLMPPAEEYVPNVEVVTRRAWDEVAAELRGRVEGLARPAPELAAVAAEVTLGLSSARERAEALYRHVNDEVPSAEGASSAVSVLLEKAGDRTVLFKALLDLAGVASDWAFLRPQEAMLPRTAWDTPRAGFFPYRYLAIDLEDGRRFVSLAERRTPFGRLPEHLEGGTALLLTARGQRTMTLPAADPEASAQSVVGTVTLTQGSAARVEVEVINRSVLAIGRKDALRNLPAFQKNIALQSFASQLFPGARLEKGDFPGLDDPSAPLVMALALEAPRILQEAGGDFLLKPVIQPEMMVARYAGRAEREHPYRTLFVRAARDRLRVEPGGGYEVRRLPQDTALSSALGTYSLTYREDGATVVVEREITLRPGRIEPAEFAAFLEFCEKCDAAEGESIVLRQRGAP